MEPSMMLEPVVSLIGDYKSTVFEDGPYPDRGDPKEHNHNLTRSLRDGNNWMSDVDNGFT